MSHVIRARAVVRGRVQGVGFRYTTLSRARMLGAVGWVRNLPSGEVEVEVQGSPEVVENLIDWLRVGPRSAIVTDVGVAPATVDPDADR
ncbi:MAG TPA: acylphosphatase, partial [Actinobacteria bacterium]|nr:acylphosphatase [Actinomycetota bacterium]